MALVLSVDEHETIYVYKDRELICKIQADHLTGRIQLRLEADQTVRFERGRARVRKVQA